LFLLFLFLCFWSCSEKRILKRLRKNAKRKIKELKARDLQQKGGRGGEREDGEVVFSKDEL